MEVVFDKGIHDVFRDIIKEIIQRYFAYLRDSEPFIILDREKAIIGYKHGSSVRVDQYIPNIY